MGPEHRRSRQERTDPPVPSAGGPRGRRRRHPDRPAAVSFRRVSQRATPSCATLGRVSPGEAPASGAAGGARGDGSDSRRVPAGGRPPWSHRRRAPPRSFPRAPPGRGRGGRGRSRDRSGAAGVAIPPAPVRGVRLGRLLRVGPAVACRRAQAVGAREAASAAGADTLRRARGTAVNPPGLRHADRRLVSRGHLWLIAPAGRDSSAPARPGGRAPTGGS